ncbi:MAG: LptF/LptG family permease [Balneolaceae bacterium]|nr:LptF/LptG family permease [Balneolaceae bacterium]
MPKKIDRYIFSRLLTITMFVLLVLIFIYVVIDFSNNSDAFTDNGATISQIFGVYYLNYIPEMVRLVMPVAVFIACLFLTGRMTDRLEIIALKAAGVSLYRLILPYLVFAILMTVTISYLDGFIIPDSNARRLAFEEEYLRGGSENLDRNRIYRQEASNTILNINYFNSQEQIGYRVELVTFQKDSVKKTMNINRMIWQDSTKTWRLRDVEVKEFTNTGFRLYYKQYIDTTLSILPRDVARTTSDIYQLTYPEAQNYIASIKRSGASGIEDPQVKFYGRLAYPLAMIVVTTIGFALAAVRRKGGRGFYIAAGLTISFLYLAFLKVIEPFGAKGTIDPLLAALLPHLIFFVLGIGLLISTRK